MSTYKLTITMAGYWFAGTGSEAGAYADSIALKDEIGLPYFPGKSLKGIFRNAFRIAEYNNWFAGRDSLQKDLFGEEGSYYRFTTSGREGNALINSADDLLTSGSLHFSNAVIDPVISDKVARNPDIKKLLFKTVQSTAIDENGVAKASSLRSYEVIIPMILKSEISYDDDIDGLDGKDVLKMLQNVSSLIMEIGGKRRRGFGRCTVEVSNED